MQDALKTLEFDRVRSALAERCATQPGQECALYFGPKPTPGQAEDFQATVAEAQNFRYGLGGVRDMRPLLADLEARRRIEGPVLLEAAYTLSAAAELKHRLLEAELPRLSSLAEGIAEHTLFRNRVAEAITESGEVRDSASPRLRHIRQRLGPLRREIHAALQALMDTHSELVQDRYITLRRDRYVIPLKAHAQNEISCIVLSRSGSGATVFVEPASVVPLNNELAGLRLAEEAEVLRILVELGQLLATDASLPITLEALVQLDLIRAAANLAQDWRLVRPDWSERGRHRLVGVRHPLIAECVPNDIQIDGQTRLLLVSGPNMGGKSVLLKTMGLAILMHQSGLFVAAERAELPWVEQLLVEIGDEQSIEANLSTFAAHLEMLRVVLEQADQGSLVLIDELGSATDPEEGAALSQAVLENLVSRGARGMITTHLSPLKAYVAEADGVINASMVFDTEAFAPTYRLQTGIPGRSFALWVARGLGFPEDTLLRAEALVGYEGQALESLLVQLQQEREVLGLALAEAHEQKEQAQALSARMQSELERLPKEREERLEQARREAERLVLGAHSQIQRLKEHAHTKEGRRDALREAMELRRQVRPKPSPTLAGLAVGMTVEVPEYHARGKVLRLMAADAVVQLGTVRVIVPQVHLRPRGDAVPRAREAVVVKSGFETELNTRGLTADEAIEAVSDFITEAAALSETEVRILHGKGGGVLRRAIRDFLRRDKRVASFQDAMPYEGGHGVTMVKLRGE